MTQCNSNQLSFPGYGEACRREIRVDFSGGRLSSDGGVLLLAEFDQRLGIVSRLSRCFRDHRDPETTEHSVLSMLRQRIYGLALGYEDLNDHDQLREDPLFAVALGVKDPTGRSRRVKRDQGRPLAGKSTLHRFEASAAREKPETERYKRIEVDLAGIQRFFTEVFLQRKRPEGPLVIDLDATDDPLHGHQEGRFFHGYFDSYCFLPLYIFCGEALLWAQLREANIDASAGAQEAIAQIVAQIRERWPDMPIILRADSGFTRDPLMAWCEENQVDFVFGMAKNKRLISSLEPHLEEAKKLFDETKAAARVFAELTYRTLDSWTRERRVIGKAEHLSKGPNPRFLVTSLKLESNEAKVLHALYCQRGDMENRIKEQQLSLFADRTSAHWLKANQLRLFFSSVAYVLLAELRRLILDGTEFAKAQVNTIRLRLLKIGAHIDITVRRVWISFSSAYPLANLWSRLFQQVQTLSSA
jgi:Transposase DDE domain group 1